MGFCGSSPDRFPGDPAVLSLLWTPESHALWNSSGLASPFRFSSLSSRQKGKAGGITQRSKPVLFSSLILSPELQGPAAQLIKLTLFLTGSPLFTGDSLRHPWSRPQ